jgi:hypothetical protein
MTAAPSGRLDRLINNLYAAAEILIESITDFDAIDAAPLNHRAQALDSVSRFIQRLEKVNAALQPAQKAAPEQEYWDSNEPVCHLEFGPAESMLTEEDIDHLVALELEDPGRFSNYRCVQRRLDYFRRSDPAALHLLDPDLAREYFATSHVADYESLHTIPPGVKTARRPAFAAG